jgi:hypothetical protein
MLKSTSGLNPDFFNGTVLEAEAAQELRNLSSSSGSLSVVLGLAKLLVVSVSLREQLCASLVGQAAEHS